MCRASKIINILLKNVLTNASTHDILMLLKTTVKNNLKGFEKSMANIISVNFNEQQTNSQNQSIDTQAIINSRRRLEYGLIQPAKEQVYVEVANEHTAEPIKSIDDIDRISSYLLKNKRYRDNMLFIVGINFGLRISDLLQLRFCQLINDDFTFKTSFPVLEKKTKNTRKVQKNRYISINDSVMDAVTIYLQNNECKLDDYLFKSESNRGSNQNKPMSRMSADRILKGIGETLSLENKMATHSLRKTFGFHQMLMSNNDPRKLLLLQKIFGHSSAAQTLEYIGITEDEIKEAYMNLNLGSRNHYLVDSRIEEGTIDSIS